MNNENLKTISYNKTKPFFKKKKCGPSRKRKVGYKERMIKCNKQRKRKKKKKKKKKKRENYGKYA